MFLKEAEKEYLIEIEIRKYSKKTIKSWLHKNSKINLTDKSRKSPPLGEYWE